MNEHRPPYQFLADKFEAQQERDDWRKKAHESLRWLRENDIYFLRDLLLVTQESVDRRIK